MASEIKRHAGGVVGRRLEYFGESCETESRMTSSMETKEYMASLASIVNGNLVVDHLPLIEEQLPTQRFILGGGSGSKFRHRGGSRRLRQVESVDRNLGVGLLGDLVGGGDGVVGTVVVDSSHSVVAGLQLLDLVQGLIVVFV
jgi:hypothetical protein